MSTKQGMTKKERNFVILVRGFRTKLYLCGRKVERHEISPQQGVTTVPESAAENSSVFEI
jgi:hypothetical protein